MTALAFHQRVLIGLSLLVVQGLAEATYTKVSNTGKTSKSITLTSVATTMAPATTGGGYSKGNVLNACSQKPFKSVKLQFASGSFNHPHQSDRDGHYVLELGSEVYNVTTPLYQSGIAASNAKKAVCAV